MGSLLAKVAQKYKIIVYKPKIGINIPLLSNGP